MSRLLKQVRADILNLTIQLICFGALMCIGFTLGWSVILIVAAVISGITVLVVLAVSIDRINKFIEIDLMIDMAIDETFKGKRR